MSEYIRSNKFDTNECANIFVKEKLIRTNVRIYIRDQYIRIFEYQIYSSHSGLNVVFSSTFCRLKGRQQVFLVLSQPVTLFNNRPISLHRILTHRPAACLFLSQTSVTSLQFNLLRQAQSLSLRHPGDALKKLWMERWHRCSTFLAPVFRSLPWAVWAIILSLVSLCKCFGHMWVLAGWPSMSWQRRWCCCDYATHKLY